MGFWKPTYLRPLLILGIPWLIALVVVILEVSGVKPRNIFGILPRSISHLQGVLLAPLLHFDFWHFLGNTPGYFLMGWGIWFQTSTLVFTLVSLFITLFSGIITWGIAPAYELHGGASGLVFGYWAFMISTLIYRRPIEFKWLIVSVLILAYNIGMIFALFKTANSNGQTVSWQLHVFGALGGGLAGYLCYVIAKKRERNDESATSVEEGGMNTQLPSIAERREDKASEQKNKKNKKDSELPSNNTFGGDSLTDLNDDSEKKPVIQYNDYGKNRTRPSNSNWNSLPRNEYERRNSSPFGHEDEDVNNPYNKL